jgi:hypothetical protein
MWKQNWREKREQRGENKQQIRITSTTAVALFAPHCFRALSRIMPNGNLENWKIMCIMKIVLWKFNIIEGVINIIKILRDLLPYTVRLSLCIPNPFTFSYHSENLPLVYFSLWWVGVTLFDNNLQAIFNVII